MYWPINVFFPQQFLSFRWLLFPELLLAKSGKLHKLLKLTNSFNFCIQLCIRWHLPWVNSYALKNVNNNVIRDSPILFQNMRIYNASNKKREWSSPLARSPSWYRLNFACMPAVKTSIASFKSQQYPRHYRRLYRRWSRHISEFT